MTSAGASAPARSSRLLGATGLPPIGRFGWHRPPSRGHL